MKRKASKIDNRRKREARYIIKHRCSLRDAAKHFAVSKTTVWNDINHYMPLISLSLYTQAREVLESNQKESLMRATLSATNKRRKKVL